MSERIYPEPTTAGWYVWTPNGSLAEVVAVLGRPTLRVERCGRRDADSVAGMTSRGTWGRRIEP